LLAAAVPGRAYFLCWMMHPVTFDDVSLFIIGPYFLVPFGLAVAILVLEIGIVSAREEVLRIALAAPVVLVLMSLVGHQSHSIYQEFLSLFSQRLGGTPVFLTLFASAGFYAYAALRRVPLALDGLTAALVGLALVPRQQLAQLALEQLLGPQPALLLATALQVVLGVRERSSVRCLVGSAGLVALAALAFPGTTRVAPLRGLIIYHLMLMTTLILGSVFDDPLGRLLRTVGSAWLALTGAVVIFVPLTAPAIIPPWLLVVYPPIVAMFLAGYGLLLGQRSLIAGAGLLSAFWIAAAGWRFYRALRLTVVGLDYMAIGLALFVVAVVISLGKSAARSSWIADQKQKVGEMVD
jgi:hypothetical protein